MISYATNNEVCRSRQLLRYFGETRSHDCGHCDVCIAHQRDAEAPAKQTTARERILQLLSDRQKHHLSEIHTLGIPKAPLDTALEYLIHEEEICIEGGFLKKK